jgi:hypothetical protein
MTTDINNPNCTQGAKVSRATQIIFCSHCLGTQFANANMAFLGKAGNEKQSETH